MQGNARDMRPSLFALKLLFAKVLRRLRSSKAAPNVSVCSQPLASCAQSTYRRWQLHSIIPGSDALYNDQHGDLEMIKVLQ
jgi:hypothetical protein